MLGHKDGHLLVKFFLPRHELLQDKLHRLLRQLVFPVTFGQVLDETVFLIVCHAFTVIYGTAGTGFPVQQFPFRGYYLLQFDHT